MAASDDNLFVPYDSWLINNKCPQYLITMLKEEIIDKHLTPKYGERMDQNEFRRANLHLKRNALEDYETVSYFHRTMHRKFDHDGSRWCIMESLIPNIVIECLYIYANRHSIAPPPIEHEMPSVTIKTVFESAKISTWGLYYDAFVKTTQSDSKYTFCHSISVSVRNGKYVLFNLRTVLQTMIRERGQEKVHASIEKLREQKIIPNTQGEVNASTTCWLNVSETETALKYVTQEKIADFSSFVEDRILHQIEKEVLKQNVEKHEKDLTNDLRTLSGDAKQIKTAINRHLIHVSDGYEPPHCQEMIELRDALNQLYLYPLTSNKRQRS
jgi:hypothetical protein